MADSAKMTSVASTLEQLHMAAEWLLAGPQYAATGEIRLRVSGKGIATVTDPDLELNLIGLRQGDWEAPYRGTVEDLARAVGIICQRPKVSYHDPVPGGPESQLEPDPDELRVIFDVYRVGDAALRSFSTAKITLWPEHFDLAIRDHDVNYGVSPGDAFSPTPYAYVGPNGHDEDPFWNAPFGAALPIGAATPPDVVAEFFESGRSRST